MPKNYAAIVRPIAVTTIGLLALFPGAAYAQSLLPLNWLYGAIRTPRCVSYSTDGSLAAVGGVGGVQVYNVQTGAMAFPISTTEATVYAAAFTPDKKQLLIAGTQKGIFQVVCERWNLATNTLVDSFNLGIAQNTNPSVWYSPDTTQLLIGGMAQNPFLQTWSTTSDKLLQSMTPTITVTGVAWSWDASLAAAYGPQYNSGAGTYKAVAQIWNANTGAQSEVLSTPSTQTGMLSAAFSKDGKSFVGVVQTAVANSIGTNVLDVWTLGTGQISKTLSCTPNKQSMGIQFTTDGTKLIDYGQFYDSGMSATYGETDVWNFPALTFAGTFSSSNVPRCSTVSPDSNVLATLSTGGPFPNLDNAYLQQWNLAAQTLTSTISLGAFEYPASTGFGYNSLSFSPDGGTLAFGGYSVDSVLSKHGGTIGLWNVNSGHFNKALTTSATGGVAATAFSPDGSALAAGGTTDPSGTAMGVAEIWNPISGALVSSLATAALSVNSISYSPAGSQLAVAGQRLNPWNNQLGGILEVWNPSTASLTISAPTATNTIGSIAYSPDGSILASCGESGAAAAPTGIIELWNPTTGLLITTLNSAANVALTTIAFSPDGTTLAVGGSIQGTQGSSVAIVEVWNVSSHKKLATMPIPTGPTVANSVAYSKDGSEIFAATDCGLEVFSSANSALLSTHAVVGSTVSVSGQSSIGAFSLSPTGSVFALNAGGTAPYEWVAISQNPYFTIPVLSLILNPTVVQGGTVSTATLTLTLPAPAGGQNVPVTSSSTSASVPGSVFIPAGSTTTTFNVTTSAVNSQTTANLSAGTGLGAKSTNLSINPAKLSALSVAPSLVIGGSTATGTVTLSGPAGPGGTTVSIFTSSSAAAVYGTAVVPANQTSTTFTITTTGVTQQSDVTITAMLGGQQMTATITVAPANITTLTVSPISVSGGNVALGTISLNGVAPSGGIFCQLTSSNSVATVPQGVSVPQGASSAKFQIATSTVTAAKSVVITATYGTTSKTASLTIGLTTVSAITFSPASVAGGTNSTGTVTLTGPTPKGGAIVKLISASTSVQVPASVTIAAGGTSASFTAKTTSVSATKGVSVSGTLNGTSQTGTLNLLPPALTSVTIKPSTVVGGIGATGTVTLSGPAPASTKIALSSSSSSVSVPATVTFASGKSSATFAIKTVAVATDKSVSLTASFNGGNQSAVLTVTAPTIKTITLSPATVKGGKSSTGTVTLSSAAPSGGLTIAVSSSSSSATTATSLVIAAGKTSGTFTIKTTAVTAKTVATLSVTLNSHVKSAQLTIN